MAEWFKAHAWKACVGKLYRGFESHSLRHFKINKLARSHPSAGQSRAMTMARPLPLRVTTHGVASLSPPPARLRGGPSLRLPIRRIRRAPQRLEAVRLPDLCLRHPRRGVHAPEYAQDRLGRRAGVRRRARYATAQRGGRRGPSVPAAAVPAANVAAAPPAASTPCASRSSTRSRPSSSRRKPPSPYSTFRKHRTFTRHLQTYAERKGYVCLDQFRPEDLDVFYARIPLGPRSKAKFLEWLRGFFQYAVNRDRLQKSPVSRDLKPPKSAARAANKMPFTDEQLEDIINACDQVEFRDRWGNRFGTGLALVKISRTSSGFHVYRPAHLRCRVVRHESPARERSIPACEEERR